MSSDALQFPTEPFQATSQSLLVDRVTKAGVSVGFIALLVGILTAHYAPANEYEASIYAATPAIFWICIAVALLVSIVVSVYAYETRLGSYALLLGGTSVAAILALPLVRNYLFYGLADPLTHLAWTKLAFLGQMGATDLVYPGSHLLAGSLAATTPLPVSRAMLLVVFLFFIAYILFIPLCVWVLVSDRRAAFIAAFSGFLFLPITNISTAAVFHAFTLAVLYLPVVFFILFKHMTWESDADKILGVLPPTSFVLPVVNLGIVYFHPMAALDLLILYGTFALVQPLYRYWYPDHPIAKFNGIYVQLLLMAVVFFWWNLQHGAMFQMAESIGTALQNAFIHNTAQTGEVVSNRQGSAQRAGVNFVMLGIKLFAVAAIYTLAAGGLSARIIYSRITDDLPPSDSSSVVIYFLYGGITLTPFILMHFVGDVSSFFFRHVGFVMVIVTIVGALALHNGASNLSISRDAVRVVAVVAVAVLLGLSLLTVFPSPFISKISPQVTDQQLQGYETLYAQKPNATGDDEDAMFTTGIRRSDHRFREALLHNTSREYLVYSGPAPSSAMRSGLPDYYANQPDEDRRDHYLPVTDAATARELVMARGVYYPAESFAALDSQWGVHKVQSNGDFETYYIDVSFGERQANQSTG